MTPTSDIIGYILLFTIPLIIMTLVIYWMVILLNKYDKNKFSQGVKNDN